MPRIKASAEAFKSSEEPKWQDEQAEGHCQYSLDLMSAEVRVAYTQADEPNNRIKQRKFFTKVFVGLAITWLGLVLTVVILDGCSSVPLEQGDAVILALLGTGTAHAIAPAFLVAKYLFPVPHKYGK